jgi:membrane protease YdiL (CAAX protease family)
MTGAEATDAIDRWLSSFGAGPRCALGLAGLVAGGVAARFVARRFLPRALAAVDPDPAAASASLAAPPRAPFLVRFVARLSAGEPRSFRVELLPTLVLIWFGAQVAAVHLFAGGGETGASLDPRAEFRAIWFVAAVVVAFLFAWTVRFGAGARDLGFTRRELGRTLAGVLVFYAVFFPAQIGAAALESGLCAAFGRAPAPQAAVLALARDPALHRDPVVVGAILLAAPLYEELLFRGVLLRYLQRLAPAVLAVLLDAALFMTVHGGGFAAVFVLGIALAWLMARTGSIAAPICFHAVHNGVALVLIAISAG